MAVLLQAHLVELPVLRVAGHVEGAPCAFQRGFGPVNTRELIL